jgi:hypothetical protein
MLIGRHTDALGRSTGDRVTTVKRHGRPVTETEHGAAVRLLDSLLDAAADHGVTLDDLDWVADLPAICLDAVRRSTSIHKPHDRKVS